MARLRGQALLGVLLLYHEGTRHASGPAGRAVRKLGEFHDPMLTIGRTGPSPAGVARSSVRGCPAHAKRASKSSRKFARGACFSTASTRAARFPAVPNGPRAVVSQAIQRSCSMRMTEVAERNNTHPNQDILARSALGLSTRNDRYFAHSRAFIHPGNAHPARDILTLESRSSPPRLPHRCPGV